MSRLTTLAAYILLSYIRYPLGEPHYKRFNCHSVAHPDCPVPCLFRLRRNFLFSAITAASSRRSHHIAGCREDSQYNCPRQSPTQVKMADTAGHDVHFESADAGASLTYPQQAGTVRKNGFLVIKGRPCKVSLLGTSRRDDTLSFK